MAPRIAINGFGRIGRLVLRALHEQGARVEVAAVNDLSGAAVLAPLLRRDSVHGKFPGAVEALDGALRVAGRAIPVLAHRDPAHLPWRDLGVGLVVEATGRFTRGADLSRHLAAGASRVLLTAPGEDIDFTVVRGVNEDGLTAGHRLVSNASCTTNCLAPVLKVIQEEAGVEHAAMTTVHAYTNDQSLVDAPHADPRRARAAGVNIIPTATGAARALHLVLPELAGRVTGHAIRVPVAAGSLLELHVETAAPTDRGALLGAFRRAAAGPLAGILGVEEDPLVSADVVHDPRSAVVDAGSVEARGRRARVLAWYDNEWGYASRVAEVATSLALLGHALPAGPRAAART